MNKIKLIAVIGRSASGKDHLVNSTLEECPELNKVVHWTTRPRRPGEVEGKDYYFITDEEFMRKQVNGDFFSFNTFRDWHYGLSDDSLAKDKINIGALNPRELFDIVKIWNDQFDLIIVEAEADTEVRYKRSLGRLKPFDEEGLKEMCRRNKADEEDFDRIKDIPRIKLDTTYYMAHEDNQAFMRGLVYALGQLD